MRLIVGMASPLPKEIRTRVLGVLRASPGASIRSIAERFRIAKSAVWKLRKRDREGEPVMPRVCGRPSQVQDKHRAWVQRQLQQAPALSSYELTLAFHQAFPEDRFHRSTVLRIIHDQGLSRKKTTVSPQREREEVKEKRATVVDLRATLRAKACVY